MNATDSAPDNRPLVIGLGPVPPAEVEPTLGSGIRFEPNPGPADLAGAQGAIVRASAQIDEAAIAQLPALQVMARNGVGYNNIDVAAATAHGIPVCITPGSNTRAVAEGAFAHMLHLVKNLAPFTALVREGRWDERTTIPMGDLDGATLGIIGFGRIGRLVAQMAEVFDMKVLAYDPVAEVPAELDASLETIYAQSDIVSLHLPLLESTRNIIDATALQAMKPGAILLNVSRGGLIDEDAALAALESGHLAGVGLDVFESEPPADHGLYQHPNTVLTPHMLGISKKAAHANYVMAAQIVRDVLEGKEPTTAVSPE
ncbi:hydroxyacid dehydrogenase [Brevibacterium sp. 50QC2O2]|uniref:hydroxyacid dehydrogenase n=1 Tax=Brevibacterium TaxID=1696 RepID=UPI00211C0A3C|nr:hydroxyacid dehydrogenase [Brevibacterium sp. 91QC2O2]MCQ9386759.1 hydroxyacid dehydrogenase [Brevibacterium sp. 68QC2CO]MCQ9389757.1 hydroxyacid dehydrogenase [Brevibacterium sp. 50QC2O2]